MYRSACWFFFSSSFAAAVYCFSSFLLGFLFFYLHKGFFAML
jgi:hypothetical protein